MANPTLADAVTRLCGRAGLDASLIDVSLLAPAAIRPVSELLGYVIERPTPAADALKVLMQAYFFDACESDGKLRFVPRAMVPRIIQSAFDDQLFGAGNAAFSKPNNPGSVLLAYCTSDNPNPAPSDTAANNWILLYHVNHITLYYAIAKDFAGLNTVHFDNESFVITHLAAYVMEMEGAPMPPPLFHAIGSAGSASVAVPDCSSFDITFQGTPIDYNITVAALPMLPSTQPLYIAMIQTPPGSNWWGVSAFVGAGWVPLHLTAWSGVFIRSAPFVIPEIDLGLLADKGELIEQILQEQDLPKQVTVMHNDPALDYQQGKQLKSRSVRVVKTKNKTEYSLPLTLTRDDARKIAETILYLAWLERSSYQMNLWKAYYMLLDPTDIVYFIYESLNFLMRISGNNLGQGFATGLDGVSQDVRNFLSGAIGAASLGFSPGTLRALANTLLFLFDIPLLRDQDSNPGGTGFYWGLSSADAGWVGGVLFDSSDDANFTQEAADGQPLAFGYATTALPAPRSPWTWDEVNTLTVTPVVGTPAGDSFLNVLNGANALLCANGELIQFRNAVQSGGDWILSGLLRGRRGTEWACGTHAIGEAIVAPQTGILRIAKPLSLIGLLRYYRAPTIGQTVSSVASQQMTLAGNDLKPYAPVDLGSGVAVARLNDQSGVTSYMVVSGDDLMVVGFADISPVAVTLPALATWTSPFRVIIANQGPADVTVTGSGVTLYENGAVISSIIVAAGTSKLIAFFSPDQALGQIGPTGSGSVLFDNALLFLATLPNNPFVFPSGDKVITWVRRTRIGGDWVDGIGTVPLSEDSESYDVEILTAPGGSVKRTISGLTTPTAVYTVAMQTADFGSQQTTVAFNLYQNSAQIGRGFKASGIAPTPGGWPAPAPRVLPGVAGSGSFYVNGS